MKSQINCQVTIQKDCFSNHPYNTNTHCAKQKRKNCWDSIPYVILWNVKHWYFVPDINITIYLQKSDTIYTAYTGNFCSVDVFASSEVIVYCLYITSSCLSTIYSHYWKHFIGYSLDDTWCKSPALINLVGWVVSVINVSPHFYIKPWYLWYLVGVMLFL